MNNSIYEKYIKRIIDIMMALVLIIVLSPIMLISFLIITIEDPGAVIFKQKRVGKNKQYFYIYKTRSMKKNTPDLPTHLLDNPDQYLLRSGKIFRKFSIDELPQLINILKGDMSFVGPRPALWSQYDLIAERDKYGANDVRPGLTGWAQINGRDELLIDVKAELDGVYVAEFRKSGLKAFAMDLRCFFGTFYKVLTAEGVVEGKNK